jgi:anion-transporting  ArsA/GET3 family ATPase
MIDSRMIDWRMVFVSGKGGVGKSAITASLALSEARRGGRVLVIGMVESIGAASHLSAQPLGYEPRRVRPGIDALAVNRSEALDEYLRLQLPVPKAAPTRVLTRALSVLAETAPGVREIVTIGKPVYEMWRSNYDLVLVDAPPLGQLFSYLRAPSTIAELVPAGPIRAQAERMSAALGDPEAAALIIVTTPDELPVRETQELLGQIEAEPVIRLAGVVANRVLPDLSLTDTEIDTLPSGPHQDAARHHHEVYTRQQRWLNELPDGPRLPYLFGIHTAGEVGEKLADVWEEVSW